MFSNDTRIPVQTQQTFKEELPIIQERQRHIFEWKDIDIEACS